METVIQKYLRNEFETIDDYNAQAGELAPNPIDFSSSPVCRPSFSAESMRRLSAIASTNASLRRLHAHQPRSAPAAAGWIAASVKSSRPASTLLQQPDGRFAWGDEVFKQFPLVLDAPPSEEFLTKLMDVVGKAAKVAKRVEVPFSSIAPPADKFWTSKSGSDVVVPIGRAGATRLQTMRSAGVLLSTRLYRW